MVVFNVEIEEVLQRVVEVEAEDKAQALRLISERYRQEEIGLNENDYKGYEIIAERDKEIDGGTIVFYGIYDK